MSKASVIMIGGRLCGGKSTYAERLKKERRAVVLSCDEITMALFDGNLGERHDEMVTRIKRFWLEKSTELVGAGVTVILDWGFWKRSERDCTREFYRSRNIPVELHYIDIDDNLWHEYIASRNQAVSDGRVSAYYVDNALEEKFESIFEAPDRSEVDVWI